MGLVELLNEGTEEAAESVRDLMAIITKLNGQMETSCAEIDEAQEDWDNRCEELGTSSSALITNLAGGALGIQMSGALLRGIFGGLNDGMTEAESELEALDTELEDLEFESLDSGIESFRTAAQAIISSCEELSGTLNGEAQELRSKLTELGDLGSETNMFVSNASDSASTFESVLQDEISEVANTIGHDLKEQAVTSLHDLETHLDTDIQAALTSGLDELQNTLGEAYTSFSDSVEERSGELQNKLGEAAENLATMFRDETREQIERALKDAAEDAVAGFARQVAEEITMMGIGTSVTGALSPILPQLKVAEKVLPAFNAALAALKFL